MLELDPERVNADFVASWLNGSDGRLVLERLAVGTAMRRFPRKELGRITVPVPPWVDQFRTVKLGTRFSGLRQEVEYLEGQLWSEAWSVGEIEDELGRLTENDPLRAWVDRLPFPLAVTVIRYMADADEEQKVKRLL